MSEKAEMVRYFAKASGRVQGVGFRMYVRENASRLGLSGWVKNMEDGTVDMEVQGEAGEVEKLFGIIKQGSFFIKVTDLALEELNPVLPPERGFSIRY